MTKLRPVRVNKSGVAVVHATSGLGGSICGAVRGFDWRLDEMLDPSQLDKVDCPGCRRIIDDGSAFTADR